MIIKTRTKRTNKIRFRIEEQASRTNDYGSTTLNALRTYVPLSYSAGLLLLLLCPLLLLLPVPLGAGADPDVHHLPPDHPTNTRF